MPTYVEMCRRLYGEPKRTSCPVGKEVNAAIVMRDSPMDSIKRILAVALLRRELAQSGGYDYSDEDDDMPGDEYNPDATPLAEAEVEDVVASYKASSRRRKAQSDSPASPPADSPSSVDSGGSQALQKPVVEPKSSSSSSSVSASEGVPS